MSHEAVSVFCVFGKDRRVADRYQSHAVGIRKNVFIRVFLMRLCYIFYIIEVSTPNGDINKLTPINIGDL